MTAHNLSVESGVDDGACAVTDSAYSDSVVLRKALLRARLY